MAINSKVKNILVAVRGAGLYAICCAVMAGCAGGNRECDGDARVDEMRAELNEITASRDAWRQYALDRGDTIRALRADNAALGDSIVLLKDANRDLADDNKWLEAALDDCRGKPKAKPVAAPQTKKKKKSRRTQPAAQPAPVVSACGQTVDNDNIVNDVDIHGCGNNVQINNGIVNNYYAPEQKKEAPADTARIQSSVSVTTYVVRVRNGMCR